MKSPRKYARAARGLQRLRQVRGAAMAEYTILVSVVGVVTIGAFISLGVALVVSFEARRDLLLYPFP